MLEINKIHQGDCLELMKEIPDKTIDLVIADPPYSLPNNQFRPKARVSQRTFGDFSTYTAFLKLFILEVKRVLKKEGHLVLFCDETFYSVLYPILYENLYAYKMIIWDKIRIGMGGIWRRRFEIIINSYLLSQKTKSGDSDIIEYKPIRNKLHNSQKPEELIKKIILKLSKEDAIILDPFSGSGTTAVVCKKLKRKYYGIEISEKYIDVSKARLKEVQMPLAENSKEVGTPPTNENV